MIPEPEEEGLVRHTVPEYLRQRSGAPVLTHTTDGPRTAPTRRAPRKTAPSHTGPSSISPHTALTPRATVAPELLRARR